MKTIYSKIQILAFLFVMILSGCSEQGEPGPQGPPGEQGPPGADGKDGEDGEDGADGANGADGKDGNTTAFYFQEGFKGYQGTKDITISDSEPTSPINPIIYANDQMGGTDDDEASALIRFDSLDKVFDQEFEDDNWVVNEAILYMHGSYAIGGGESIAAFSIAILDSVAPLYDENVVTYEIANADENWPKPCEVCIRRPGPQFSFPISYEETFQANENSISISKLFAFRLSRSIVERWIKNPETNKGIMLNPALYQNVPAKFNFLSSDYNTEDARPLLYINAERIDDATSGRKARLSEEDYFHEWQQMSVEEKMSAYYNKD